MLCNGVDCTDGTPATAEIAGIRGPVQRRHKVVKTIQLFATVGRYLVRPVPHKVP